MTADRLRALIVDDEPLARRGLQLRLRRHPDIEVVAQAGNVREGLLAIAEHRPQLMFLDIQMPGGDGFSLLRALKPEDAPATVLVTAHDRHAVQAFSANAIDYLLKPVDDARLAEALQRIRRRIAAERIRDDHAHLLRLVLTLPSPEQARFSTYLSDVNSLSTGRLTIRDGNRRLVLDMASIRWIDAAGDYMCLHAGDETHIIRGTMREFEQRLDPSRFARIHRSTIVNIDRIRAVHPHTNGEAFLILDNGHELKVSRSYRHRLDMLAS